MARADVVSILARVASPRDVGTLFESLGYQLLQRKGIGDAFVVAKYRAFEVQAIASTSPDSSARALARQMGTRGLRGLAVAFDANRLACAAPRAGRALATSSLLLTLRTPQPYSVQRLTELAPEPTTTALEHWLRVVQVLSTEALGRRFFLRFREYVDRVAATFDGRHSKADRRLVALIILTRVLFLYFVQEKGWLDGDRRYLVHRFDQTMRHGRDFHRECFVPLCFGVLNRAPTDRPPVALDLGHLPYLNGGLFEPHPIERRLHDAAIAPDLWRDLFDGLFERFRFCPDESEDSAAIAPDMLGHVFEQLMTPSERLNSGAFYTPSHLVAKVVDAAIATCLCGRGITEEAVLALMSGVKPPTGMVSGARGVLRSLTLLDPAVGSGAFLVRALHRMTELRCLTEVSPKRPQIRRDVLRDNLFGVDRDPLAVRLCELRLWLALIADADITEPGAVTPLPNLDGVVRQGDTLMDPVTFLPSRAPNSALARATAHLARRRHAVFEARGPTRTEAIRALRRAEFHYADRALEAAIVSTQRAIAELTTITEERDLFGERATLSESQEQELKRRRDARETMLQAQRRLREHGEMPFFSFGVHAAGIMAAGGFSIVVGNPPWVRAERLTASYREELERRFRLWCAKGRIGYAHQPDLAIAFLERGLSVTAPGGVVAMLVPSKLTTSGYAEPLRRHLARATTIVRMERVADRDAAQFGATTYPLMLVVRNAAPQPDHTVSVASHAKGTVEQEVRNQDGPWIVLPSKEREALDAFRASGRPLAEFSTPGLGVKTGADAILVGRPIERDGDRVLMSFGRGHAWIEASCLRPAIKGRDVRAFHARPSRAILWLLDERGAPLERLPQLAGDYVRRYDARLRVRADYRRGAPWRLFRLRGALGKHRLVWSDLAKRPRSSVLESAGQSTAIPLNSCYVAAWRDRDIALAASCVLNSTWAALLAHARADEARGGYRRINAQLVGGIPIPPHAPARTALVEVGRAAHAGRPIPSHELDDLVADALSIGSAARTTIRELANHRFREPSRRP